MDILWITKMAPSFPKVSQEVAIEEETGRRSEPDDRRVPMAVAMGHYGGNAECD